MSKKKVAVPDIPAKLSVPIVDNHTHISVDPAYLDVPPAPSPSSPALLDFSSIEPSTHIACAQQKLTDDGKWRYPVTETNLVEGMEQAGIRAAITSGCEVPELASTLALTHRHPGVIYAALAIHPNEAALHAGVRETAPDGLPPNPKPWHEDLSLNDAVTRVAELAFDPSVLAVGETGLDYFRTGDAGREAQKVSFRAHIALAKELGKPMQIHDRDAHADVVEILLAEGAPERTVFHSFSGDAELAAILAEHGWYASFSGPITYGANSALREAFLTMPPELILVETDAPYLTPEPFRGHPNTPWGAAYTARYMAWLRYDPDAAVTLANATNAQVQAAAASVSADFVDEWCAQLDANTREVYGI